MVFLHKENKELTENFTLLLKKMKSTKKNIKIFYCDNAGTNKTLEENCTQYFEENYFDFTLSGTPQKNVIVE